VYLRKRFFHACTKFTELSFHADSEIIGVHQGRERPRRLEPLCAARLEASRAGSTAAHIEFCTVAC
jgi:hypothetical protein